MKKYYIIWRKDYLNFVSLTGLVQESLCARALPIERRCYSETVSLGLGADTKYFLLIDTLLEKKVVTPPMKTIKPMWIELLCFHLAEIGMILTRNCSPTKSDTTLGRHSMQGQVGS